jgi:hypothetical protein
VKTVAHLLVDGQEVEAREVPPRWAHEAWAKRDTVQIGPTAYDIVSISVRDSSDDDIHFDLRLAPRR